MATASDLVQRRGPSLLAADAETFAGGGDALPFVRLIAGEFTPARDMDLAALLLMEADFDGYTAGIGAVSGTQNTAVDPLTQDSLLQLKEPAGGFRWVTADTPGIDQTIFGWIATDSEGTRWFAADLFNPPIVLNGPLQVVEVEGVTLRFLLNGIR